MIQNYIHRDITEALPSLLDDLLEHGAEVGSRNGRVKELMHTGITLTRPWRRELLVQGRKPNLAAQIAETMWVLAGRNDVEFLGHYLPRAGDFSDDGKVWRGGYGPRLRSWAVADEFELDTVDQLAEVVRLLSVDPLSRRAVMSIFDPAQDFIDSKDIPCNNWLSFSSRNGYLDLHVAIRSNDAMWGWSGINAFEWSALQEVVAGLLGISVGSLHFSTTSFHLYQTHWDKAERIVDIARDAVPGPEADDSPRFKLPTGMALAGFDNLVREWFKIEAMIRDVNSEEDELAAVDAFPEPMMRSWLRVLQWWWSGELEYLAPLEGTRLETAARYAIQPKQRDAEAELVKVAEFHATYAGGPGKLWAMIEDKASNAVPVGAEPPRYFEPTDFIKETCQLHIEKHAAYGPSWKKRGESFSIIPNIARKVDRLGAGETTDENQADTAADLMVYLAKYRVWLDDAAQPNRKGWYPSDGTEAPNKLLLDVDREQDDSFVCSAPVIALEQTLRDDFDSLLDAFDRVELDRRVPIVDGMLRVAYRLARLRWDEAPEIKAQAAFDTEADDSVNADHE